MKNKTTKRIRYSQRKNITVPYYHTEWTEYNKFSLIIWAFDQCCLANWAAWSRHQAVSCKCEVGGIFIWKVKLKKCIEINLGMGDLICRNIQYIHLLNQFHPNCYFCHGFTIYLFLFFKLLEYSNAWDVTVIIYQTNSILNTIYAVHI